MILEKIRDFNVLKFVGHGENYEATQDIVEGELLVSYLQSCPHMEKEILFEWIESVFLLVYAFQQTTDTGIYRFVTPFSFVVLKEKKLALLDLNAKENNFYISYMENRKIKDAFLPDGQEEYLRGDFASDYYGAGKTMQYMMARIKPGKRLTHGETRKILKIISICTSMRIQRENRKWYQSQILRLIPTTKKKREKKKKRGKTGIVFVVVLFIISGFLFLSYAGHIRTKKKSNLSTTQKANVSSKNQENSKKETQKSKSEIKKMYLEMGFVQALELKEYEQAKQYYEKLGGEDELGCKYTSICNFLAGHVQIGEEQMLTLLSDTEALVQDNRDYRPQMLLFRSYEMIHSTEAKEKQLTLGEKIMSNSVWKNTLPEKLWEELYFQMGAGYDESNQNEKAVEIYQTILTEHAETQLYNSICVRLSQLYQELKRSDLALESAKKGVEKVPLDVECRIQVLRVYKTMGKAQEKEMKRMIESYIKECPSLSESEEFRKLMTEQGINIKEGKIIEK